VTSNLFLRADESLVLTITNLLTDTGPTNGSVWIVGSNAVDNGFQLLRKPLAGDLLGTTITNYAPSGKNVLNIWAGIDRGVSVNGYVDNAAVGRLILDGLGPVEEGTLFTFNGATPTNNALYVDYLELRDG